MVNLLGLPSNTSNLQERLNKLREIDSAKLHWYSKDQETPGRKLGHLTLPLYESDQSARREKALDFMKKIRLIWPIYVPEID